jgi:hypothetical protein
MSLKGPQKLQPRFWFRQVTENKHYCHNATELQADRQLILIACWPDTVRKNRNQYLRNRLESESRNPGTNWTRKSGTAGPVSSLRRGLRRARQGSSRVMNTNDYKWTN